MLAKTSKKILRVAFFGDADAKEKDQHFKDAYEAACLLAQNGYIIINGGGPGVMLAATLGAKKGGGKVELAVLKPEKQPDNYEGINKENYELADKVYKTNDYPERLNKLIEIADAFVIFKGGTGTLSEVGMVWELAKFEYGNYEPLIFVGEEWKEVVEKLENNMNYEKKERRVVETVNSAEEVLRALKHKPIKEGWFKMIYRKLDKLF